MLTLEEAFKACDDLNRQRKMAELGSKDWALTVDQTLDVLMACIIKILKDGIDAKLSRSPI